MINHKGRKISYTCLNLDNRGLQIGIGIMGLLVNNIGLYINNGGFKLNEKGLNIGHKENFFMTIVVIKMAIVVQDRES